MLHFSPFFLFVQAKGVRFASYSLPLDWALGVRGLEQGQKPHHPSRYPLSGITTCSRYELQFPACPVLCFATMYEDEETCVPVSWRSFTRLTVIHTQRKPVVAFGHVVCTHVCACTVGDIGNVAISVVDRPHVQFLEDTLVMHNKNLWDVM